MFYAKQIVGNRKQQEDSYLAAAVEVPDRDEVGAAHLFIVADGMGGHSGGEIASGLAVEAFAHSLRSSAQWDSAGLASALHDANRRIAQEVHLERSLAGMGTTLLGVLRQDNRLSWVSVGDSLLLLFRESDLRRLNEDHSMLPDLIAAAEARGSDREAAYRDPRRHRLRSALTGKPPDLVDQASCQLHPDDLVILASDGIEALTHSQLRELLVSERGRSPRELAGLILASIDARNEPQQDNVTLILYRHSAAAAGHLSIA